MCSAGFLIKGGILGIQGRIFVSYYLEQGKILVPFEEYIAQYKIASITVFVCKILQGLGVGPGSVTERWPFRKNARKSVPGVFIQKLIFGWVFCFLQPAFGCGRLD